ncbi:MAG: prolyl oligopeptidase family serine peptidase [Pseudomonadota bacterium]
MAPGLTLETTAAGPIYGPGDDRDALVGVVIVHGSEGPMAGWAHRFAAILAAHGMLALPIGYGDGDFWRAGPIRDVDLAVIPRALQTLRADPRCARVGVFGWSRGGEMVLLAASLLGAGAIPCVAAHAPADVVNNAFDPVALRAGGDWRAVDPDGPCAWALDGQDAALRPGTEIAIERFQGPVFLSVGTADDVWDPAMTRRLADRLAAAGNPADLLIAEGQGHGYDFDREPELWARLIAFFGRAAA